MISLHNDAPTRDAPTRDALTRDALTRRPRDEPRAGFTLIEMIVVLSILGLALTIVVGFIPRRSSMLELTTTSERVASVLRLSRARATTESRLLAVTMAPGGNRLVVDGVPLALSPGVMVSMTGSAVIRFVPDGSSSGGGIRLESGGRIRFVIVDWLTGRVRVADVLDGRVTDAR
jgi:general secretion pathway protein H